MSLHTEINFENDICAHLSANGWLHDADDANPCNWPSSDRRWP